jgi:hypothetical protein
MDESEKKYSYPNSDQTIAGVDDVKNQVVQPKPVVHILDALTNIRKEDDVRNIRTYQEDITDAIKNDNVSMIKIALAEKKRQDNQNTYNIEVKDKADIRKYILIGGIVVVTIIIILSLLYMSLSNNVVPGMTQATQNQSLIYTESSIVFSADKRDVDDISRLIKKERDIKLKLGDMKEIILTLSSGTSTRKITTEDFFRITESRTPESLVRSLEPDFMLGAYSFTPHDLFAVFRVNTYDTAFAGMLQWEPSIESDIGSMFISRKAAVLPTNSPTSTTTQKRTMLGRRGFVDKTIDNRDTRVILNEDNTIALLYTFFDKNTLIIASSDKALKELTFRLTSGRIAR